MRRALALALCALAGAPAARAACPPVPAPPSDHAPASAAQIDAYVRAVGRASPVISTGVAGFSVQGRPLRYAVVSALPRNRLRAALARMSALERSAFTLRHVEGMSIAEISRALDLDASAAKQSVFRAVRKLRQALGEHAPWGATP